jgi:hypothetical protein
LSAESTKSIIFTDFGLKKFALLVIKQTYLADINILPFHTATSIAFRLMYIKNSEKTLSVITR